MLPSFCNNHGSAAPCNCIGRIPYVPPASKK